MVSRSAAETEALAARVAARLRPGDVVALHGELGSGKTTFVRGAARGLGVTGPVTSPTYTIGHRYLGAVPVSHLDLYRLPEVGDEDWAGLEPYLEDAVVLVEWPEGGAGRLPVPRLTVTLEHVDPGTRRIVLAAGEPALVAGLP